MRHFRMALWVFLHARLVESLYCPPPSQARTVDPMKKSQPKVRRQAANAAQATMQAVIESQVIPAPTIVWNPSVSLEKLISDFSEHRDALIVS
jgi:hypothetical protein